MIVSQTLYLMMVNFIEKILNSLCPRTDSRRLPLQTGQSINLSKYCSV